MTSPCANADQLLKDAIASQEWDSVDEFASRASSQAISSAFMKAMGNSQWNVAKTLMKYVPRDAILQGYYIEAAKNPVKGMEILLQGLRALSTVGHQEEATDVSASLKKTATQI